MSHAGDEPVFDGVSGLKCEGFIQLVRRKAFSEGKAKDDEWMAVFAGTCFDGSALRWYEHLDEDVQESWKLLRSAMLLRWPASEAPSAGGAAPAPSRSNLPTPAPSAPLGSRALPTPAAAPPQRAPAPPPRSAPVKASPSLTLGTGRPRGRIQVVYDNGAHYGYVSDQLNKHGLFQTTNAAAGALKVEFSPSHIPHNLWSISGPTKGNYIGMTWASPDATAIETGLSQGLTYWAGLATMASSQNGVSIASSSILYTGPSRSCIWNLLINGSLLLMWESTLKRLNSLDIAVHPAGGYFNTIQVTSNFEVFSQHHTDGWTKARLVFEPLE